MINRTQTWLAKKEQKRVAIIVSISIAALLASIYYLAADTAKPKKINPNKEINFTSPLDKVDVESIVLERTQKQLQETENKTEKLQKQIEQLENTKKSEDQSKQSNVENLIKRVDELENQLKSVENRPDANLMMPSANNIFPSSDDLKSLPSMIREDRLSLTPNENFKKPPIKNPHTYVPAGTFVKAVIVGGADASASVNAQSNPKVMLLRIIEEGTLPNHKKSHLKDCMVVARVKGDISSERGSIDTERLSCVFKNNEVVDQAVVGVVFGPDGKVDVRGNVWEGGMQYVGRAFAAGALSGISEGIGQSYTANSISPEGNVQTVNSGRIFQFGAAKGAGKAMDKLADYEIHKAEQFHPVIQLSAGTVVDIVFQKGFFLDGKNHEDKDNTIGNYDSSLNQAPTLFPAINSTTESSPLPLSPKAIDRLEKYNKELGLRVTHVPDDKGEEV